MINYMPPPGGYSATTLTEPENVYYIQFTNGVLSSFGFTYSGGSPSCQPTLGVGSTSYNYTEVCFLNGGFPMFYSDSGTVTITPAAATTGVTPEPSGMVLLGTGMLAVLGVVRRRFLRQDEGVS